MATYLRKLKDRNGNTIVPATKFAGVFQDGSNQSLSVWTENMSEWVQKLEKRIDTKATKLECYPVGAIYMAIGGSSPASLFGGHWTQIVGKYIRAKNSSQDSGTTGGNNNVTLQPANIPTLSTQILLSKGGYCAGGKIPQSFVKSSKDPSVVNNNLFADLNGQPCDRIIEGAYENSSLVRYYNPSVKVFTAMPEYINVNCWQRVS